LFQQVLRAWQKNLGKQHPDTLTAMYSLACVYTSQGRYGDAHDLLVVVLAARERVLGLSDPVTQDNVDLLVWLYEKLGRSNDAMMLKQRISQSLC
jgi:hypothetical protein